MDVTSYKKKVTQIFQSRFSIVKPAKPAQEYIKGIYRSRFSHQPGKKEFSQQTIPKTSPNITQIPCKTIGSLRDAPLLTVVLGGPRDVAEPGIMGAEVISNVADAGTILDVVGVGTTIFDVVGTVLDVVDVGVDVGTVLDVQLGVVNVVVGREASCC